MQNWKFKKYGIDIGEKTSAICEDGVKGCGFAGRKGGKKKRERFIERVVGKKGGRKPYFLNWPFSPCSSIIMGLEI